jgi:hypothetical protein
VTGPLADILAEARRLVALGEERNARVRLIGGLAILAHAHQPLPEEVERNYGDIDLVVRRQDGDAIQTLMADAGYAAFARFNALRGERRLMFQDESNDRRVDVFVDRFEMCHSLLDLGARLPEVGETLSLADLVLTKLQIVELNLKDVVDALVLFRDHECGDEDPEAIDVRRIRDVCSDDWGWYTTVSDNLARLQERVGGILPADAAVAQTRISQITEDLQSAAKSRRWKLRSKVGRRVPWYRLPDEV